VHSQVVKHSVLSGILCLDQPASSDTSLLAMEHTDTNSLGEMLTERSRSLKSQGSSSPHKQEEDKFIEGPA